MKQSRGWIVIAAALGTLAAAPAKSLRYPFDDSDVFKVIVGAAARYC